MSEVDGLTKRLALRLKASDEEKATVAEYIPEIGFIADEQARDRCALIWAAAWKSSPWPDLMDVPSLHGLPVTPANNLVSHTRRVTRGCRALANELQRPELADATSTDDLIEAAILHDVGKILEYEPDDRAGQHRYSQLGETMPHSATAAFWALETGSSKRVARAIYVHTPAVVASPGCLEAVILFAVDQCDTDAARIGQGWPPLTKRHFAGPNDIISSSRIASALTDPEGH